MKEVRLGIVGLGRFAQLHLQCYRQIPGARVAAVCDIREETALQVAADFGCQTYTDPGLMLQNETLDALVVLTPETLHTETVMAGIAAGCAVFVEKPLATVPAEARRMVDAAAERGTLLMVGHVTRFDPRYLQMKTAIANGTIGRVRSIYARRSDGRQYFHIYKRTPAIYTLGIHDIDQVLWYMGEMPVEVYAKASSSAEGEDLVWTMLTFANGATAVIDSNWMTPNGWPAHQDQLTHVVGDGGVISFGHPDGSLRVCTETLDEVPYLYGLRDIYGKLEGPLYSELKHFIECVQEGLRTSPILPAEDALRVVLIADAVMRSCAEGLPVRLAPETP
ncbi:MAG: Gfo/Idh/MocA family oxidoreductase [Paenibacillaceae bacterium]|nr:Gfo/Idh/MocA family oxidoreductase [Paenibacillaceae bacterium]